MSKKKVTVTFQDHHQDFLEWDIEECVVQGVTVGKVTDARPFQASIWTQYYVTNFRKLKKGGEVHYSKGPSEPIRALKYRITEIKVL